MNKKYIRNQKGAISMFVMLSMLFFLVFILGIYTMVVVRNRAQIESLTEVKSIYKGDADSIYSSRIASADEVVPIYTKEQLDEIGTGNSFEIDGKIYTFEDNSSYIIKMPIYFETIHQVPDLSDGNIDTNNNIVVTNYNYITDNNFRLFLDGINNTGDEDHKSGISEWTNLVSLDSDNNGILQNSPTWGENYLNFNGSTQWVNCGMLNTTNTTMELVVSYNAVNKTMASFGNWESGGGGIYLYNTNNLEGEYYLNSAYRKIIHSENIVSNKLYSVSLVHEDTDNDGIGDIVKFYVNGSYISSTTSTIGDIASNASTRLVIGGNPSSGTSPTIHDYANCKIYSARVYDRGLTEDEVLNNYNIDKARFNF